MKHSGGNGKRSRGCLEGEAERELIRQLMEEQCLLALEFMEISRQLLNCIELSLRICEAESGGLSRLNSARHN